MKRSHEEMAATTDQDVAGSETVTFKIQYAKSITEVTRSTASTIGQLKAEIDKLYDVPAEVQKLMFKGMLKDDDATLEKVGIKAGTKVMLIGSSRSQIDSAKPKEAAAASGDSLAWDHNAANEPPSKQAQHAKVLAKGKPDDAMTGIKDRQVALTDAQQAIPGLMNNSGNKVRLTFKSEMEQLWIGSAASTQKVPYGTIAKIESFPIEGQEEYSMMSLQLGSSGTSKYWLYWVPSQYTAAIKMRIKGVMALL